MMYNNNFVAVIKYKGRILRERDGAVKLPFGSEYSILLKNKNSRKALVQIQVDDKYVLNGGQKLIVDAHDTVEIKGFMRDMSVSNRFKFIKKTEQIRRHRGDCIDDGLISVEYWFEKEPDPDPIWYYNVSIPSYKETGRRIKSSGDFVDVFYNDSSSNEIRYGSSMNCSYSDNTKRSSKVSDDGITVKGSKVQQDYVYGNINDVENSSSVITIQLKGRTKKARYMVKKAVTTRTRLTCETCGKKSKSYATFCSRCGTHLD